MNVTKRVQLFTYNEDSSSNIADLAGISNVVRISTFDNGLKSWIAGFQLNNFSTIVPQQGYIVVSSPDATLPYELYASEDDIPDSVTISASQQIATYCGEYFNLLDPDATTTTTSAPSINITQQPTNQTFDENGTASFSVVAESTDSSTLIYQWQLLSGTEWLNTVYTSSTMSLSGLTSLNDGQQYRVLISTDTISAVTSNEVTLTYTPTSTTTTSSSTTTSTTSSTTSTTTVAPVTPLMTDLQLWLDADDASTITVNGTSDVSNWADKSVHGRDVSQLSAAFQPTVQLGAQNGKNAIRFDGLDDYLANDAIATIANSSVAELTIFVVYQGLRVGQNNYFLSFGSSASITPFYGLLHGTLSGTGSYGYLAAQQRTDANALSNAFTTSSATDAFQLQTTIFGTSNLTIFENGTQLTNLGLTQAQTTCDTFTLGSWRRLNAMDGLGFANTDICEVLIYNTTLSTSDRQYMESYLINKWGIS